MLKKEMNESIISHLKDYFESKEYKLKKTSEVIYFRKKLHNGFQHIAITSDNYYHTHFLHFAYGKRVEEIERVMAELEKCFEHKFFLLRKDNLTYAFSPTRVINDKNKKEIKKEIDVVEAINAIKDFTEKYAFALFDFLDNLKKVDAEINGEGGNFWLDDDNKKFGMNRFDVRRIVIAKLAKTPQHYKAFTEKLMTIEDKKTEELRKQQQYKNLTNWFVPKIIKHLDEIVKN